MSYERIISLRRTLIATGVAAALPLAGASAEDWQGWSKMQSEVVSIEDIMTADLTNGINPIGEVSDVVLTPDTQAVEYVLYEVPYPYSFYGSRDGFTRFDNLEILPDAGLEVQLRLDDEADAMEADELTLTRGETDHRLVSNLLDESMHFGDGQARRIVDILANRQTGEITHFVVDMETDSLFSADRRTIPADMVSIDEKGAVSASADIPTALAMAPDYDPVYL